MLFGSALDYLFDKPVNLYLVTSLLYTLLRTVISLYIAI